MRKTFKKIMAGLLTICAMVGTISTYASAYRVTGTDKGTFEWFWYEATITDLTNQNRLIDVSIMVYEDNTGVPVELLYTSKITDRYINKSLTLQNKEYPATEYNFELYGRVYNSTAKESGSLWFSGLKYHD